MIEIIDYKTGSPKLKLNQDDKSQLLMYYLAFETDEELKKIGTVSKLTFYYLENQTKLSFEANKSDLEVFLEKIIFTVRLMQNSSFEATPGRFTCSHCDYKNICPFRII